MKKLRRRISAEHLNRPPPNFLPGEIPENFVANHQRITNGRNPPSSHPKQPKHRKKELNRRSSDTVIYTDSMDGPRTEQESMEQQRLKLEALAVMSVSELKPATASPAAMLKRQQQLNRRTTVGHLHDPQPSAGRRGSAGCLGGDPIRGSMTEGIPPSRSTSKRGAAKRSSTTYTLPLDDRSTHVSSAGRTDSGRGDGLGLRDGATVQGDHADARQRLPSTNYAQAQASNAMPHSLMTEVDEGLDFEDFAAMPAASPSAGFDVDVEDDADMIPIDHAHINGAGNTPQGNLSVKHAEEPMVMR
jgi:hypothetical protein